jgi:hypothetical protein
VITRPIVTLDQVIVELAHLGQARPPWRWFEINLDHISPADLLRGVPREVAAHGPVRANAMTRQHEPALIRTHLARGRAPGITHVQYHVQDARTAEHVAQLVREQGLIPLPSIHLDSPPTARADLQAAIDLLARLGEPLVKLAYPAPGIEHLRWGLDAFTAFRQPATELVIVPMGTLRGRAEAVAASSRLIWVLPVCDGDQWGADQLLPVTQET